MKHVKKDGSPSISEEDSALFHEAMHCVKPLKSTPRASYNPRTPAKKNTAKVPLSSPSTCPYYVSNHYSQVVGTESILTYKTHSLSRQRFSQLKQGHIPREAILDLHGLTIDAARDALCEFIYHQIQIPHRCVLIIHGKGSLHGEPPILKNHVHHWLPQLPPVLAFHSALAREGGAGALYVLLKHRSVHISSPDNPKFGS